MVCGFDAITDLICTFNTGLLEQQKNLMTVRRTCLDFLLLLGDLGAEGVCVRMQ